VNQVNQVNQSSPYKSSYRSEIDGLRAFAVLSVVAFHAFPSWLKGGFIGVDVFFVISGFLITSHIFENLDKGQFSFTDFFGRRIRRIFPALILVMACSLAFGWFALLADEFAQLGKHVASGAAFITNFILVDESGYFDKAAETKPMLHLWSLAVEEQFYIVWPLVLWLAWKRKFNLLTITILVAVVSFYLNLRFVKSYPTETFFWPVGRFWELLSGSILAWLLLYKSDLFSRVKLWLDKFVVRIIHSKEVEADGSTISNLMSFLGLLLLAYGVIRINESLSFPSKWALIPVLGAVLIIASGSKAWLNRIFLMNPIAVWFGLISYPLYLWHWPILSYLQILSGENPARELRIMAVLLSIFLAWATYYFLERYFRASRLSVRRLLVLIVGISLIGLLGLLVSKEQIKSYLATFFPNQQMLADILPTPINEKRICFERLGISEDSKIRYCRISSKDDFPSVALIGDSHSSVAFEGTSYYLKKEHNVTTLNLAGRLFSNVVNAPKGNEFEENNYLGGFEVADFIAKNERISTVVMVARGFFYINWAENLHIPSKPHITDKKDVFIEGLRDLLDRLSNKKIIFVLENPTLTFDPRNCGPQRLINLFSKNCSISRNEDDAIHKEYITRTKELMQSYKNVVLVNPRDELCDDEKCYASKGGRVLYGDYNHLNPSGSFIQGKQISDAFHFIKDD